MRLFPLVCAVLLISVVEPALAAQRSVTLFLDGARVEEEVRPVKGYLEYPLPDSFTRGSLRVKAVGAGNVLRVEIATARLDKAHAQEVARLERRKGELLDRIEALATREEIFKAAAKSQSGKAAKKTKSNPDPLSSLRQGTEFALGRLDATSRDKRRCERALEEVSRKLAAAGKGRTVALVWLSAGRARLSYLRSDQRWVPAYDFRWSGDSAGELLLHARLPRAEKGVLYLVSNGTLAQGAAPRPVGGGFPTLARYPLTLQAKPRTEQPPFSFSFQRLEAGLPPGEATAYWRGEYLGSGRFAGGDATELAIGAQ